MSFESWRDLYTSDLQSVYAVAFVPALFLIYLLLARPAAPASEPRGATFLRRYALFFGLETILDPIVTGPLVRWLGIGDTITGTVVMVVFVLIGDFRVFLLVFFLSSPQRALRGVIVESALWTAIVPIVAVSLRAALGTVAGNLPPETIWLVYELSFFAMALYLRGRVVPERAHGEPRRVERLLRATTTYVATYYLLWAVADVIILVLGVDLGWALRIVPNQMYYAWFVPFVYVQFFARR